MRPDPSSSATLGPPPSAPLRSLARAMGVRTRYLDGLRTPVTVGTDTLMAVCAALGAAIERPDDAAEALRAIKAAQAKQIVPPVIVAWNGHLAPLNDPRIRSAHIALESNEYRILRVDQGTVLADEPLPSGYHRLEVETSEGRQTARLIAARSTAWRPADPSPRWGGAAQLAALRSSRSRSVGDLADLRMLGHWLHEKGGGVVGLLPLLPTFNGDGGEPSPYAPVSRLFWSELILDLEQEHSPVGPVDRLDMTRAMDEVVAALAHETLPIEETVGDELRAYARFRGAQARLGRNWRVWPEAARHGALNPDLIDADVERFHRVAQIFARNQIHDVCRDLERNGIVLGLDLPVGSHPDGYDIWSRQHLFAQTMSVGAPPDAGFPSGQNWGFSPMLPTASRQEGHQFFADVFNHQAAYAGVLRLDHAMGLSRLYWIPDGMALDQGTYVECPAEELFAIVMLESRRCRCRVVAENLGTVPRRFDRRLREHGLDGMYVAQFQSPLDGPLRSPRASEVAMIGTHDTPTFAGWISSDDVGERVANQLLRADQADSTIEERNWRADWLARSIGSDVSDPRRFLERLLVWLGASESPLVTVWLEDLWLEVEGVNLPGTSADARPNWQRPMRRLLDEIVADAGIAELVERLEAARRGGGGVTGAAGRRQFGGRVEP